LGLRDDRGIGYFAGMNPPRVGPEDYLQMLVASPKVVSATEAARVQPDRPQAPAHDAFTRLLHRLEPDAETLWNEVQPLIRREAGVLVLDDSTLDKPRARHIELVSHHWSGNHHRVVRGINLVSLVWTDGDTMQPCDYRIYHKGDGLTKNDHFAAMLEQAAARGFQPRGVLFDGWYASVDNLKRVRRLGWTFLTRLKSNRKVRVNRGPAAAIDQQTIAASGTVVWLPEYGEVRVFRVVAPDGDTQHWATNDLGMEATTRLVLAELSWSIEEYHRGLKQFTGVERCQVRAERGQRNHIGFALRAFVRLEYHRFKTGVSWFEAKCRIIREAIRAYLSQPIYTLPLSATA
jgi:DDE superfamily endonuclease